MPLFAAVVDQEKARAERDDFSEDMRKHRAFDAGVTPQFSQKEVFGNNEEDVAAQKVSKSGNMVKNAKGLWVKADKPRDKKPSSEATTTQQPKRHKKRRNEFGEYVIVEPTAHSSSSSQSGVRRDYDRRQRIYRSDGRDRGRDRRDRRDRSRSRDRAQRNYSRADVRRRGERHSSRERASYNERYRR